MPSRKTKIRKTLNIVLRVLIILVTWGFIYREVLYHRQWDEIIRVVSGIADRSGLILGLAGVVVLMVLNWGIESGKWQFMIGKIEKISFLRAYVGVLTGVSVSSFTPNRIGEYFGRVFILDKASHVKGILITILGSMSQLLITLLTGSLALILFMPGFLPDLQLKFDFIYHGIVILIVILDVLLLLIYFNVSLLFSFLERLLKGKRLEKIHSFLEVFSYFRTRELLCVISLSFIRYMVFSCQYFILLSVFSVPVSFPEAMILISLVFFLTSAIPSIALTELGIRDSVALYFFGIYFSRNGIMSDPVALGVLAASTGLWVVNLAIPAIAGTFFVLRLRFFRKNGNGNSIA